MKRLTIFLTSVFIAIAGLNAQTYEEVVARFNEGADDINKGEFQTAIDHLNEVIAMSATIGAEADELAGKAREQIPLLNYQIAIGYMKQKDYENAIPYLEKTVDLADEYQNNADYKEKAMKYLPTLLTGVGTQKLKEEDKSEALRMFEHASKYSPNYPKAYLGQGMVYKANFEEAKMIETLSRAIELGKAQNDTKTVQDAQEALGDYFAVQGNMELEDVDPEAEDFTYAIEAFERALEYHPANTDAHLKLAMIYNRMIEFDKAIEHGRLALETETDELKIAAINFELGNAYVGNADYELACQAYNNALVGVFEERAMARKEKVPGCQ
jgi:tetratricopeptide (TPR) repeat protein